MPSKLQEIVQTQTQPLLEAWMGEQASRSGEPMKRGELREQGAEFLKLFGAALQTDARTDPNAAVYQPLRELLENVSRSRAVQGFSPSETAGFVFALKGALLPMLRKAHGADAASLFEDVALATKVLDVLGLYTTEVQQKAREAVISRQQAEMLELSTPVVKLWDGVVALPLIGTLDSARTQVVMETLLQKIVETGAPLAIIDITGVPTVDTLVAQHLIKTVTAARLMGAECIISGIRPQIAQTIVHLGVDLGDVITKGSLADAFKVALGRIGLSFTRTQVRRTLAAKGV